MPRNKDKAVIFGPVLADPDSTDNRRSQNASDEPQIPACSFCGRSRDDVSKLIAGPGVFICCDCAELVVEVCGRERN